MPRHPSIQVKRVRRAERSGDRPDRLTVLLADGDGPVRFRAHFDVEDDHAVASGYGVGGHGASGSDTDALAARMVAAEYLRHEDGLTVEFAPIASSGTTFGSEAPFYSVPGHRNHIVQGRSETALCGADATGHGGSYDSAADALGLHNLCGNCRQALEAMADD